MRSILLIAVFLIWQYSHAQLLNKFTLTDTQGTKHSLTQIASNKATVLVFLSPTCPLCQKYSLTLRNLAADYAPKGVAFYGIAPGKNYTNTEFNDYATEYLIKFPILTDPKLKLTKKLNATITPEVVVFNARGQVVYQGKIDNWYESIGTRRSVITEHYLADALEATLANTQPKVTKTTAVGCFISF